MGDTLPNKLAEGATIGLPNCLIICMVIVFLGIRIPTLSFPPVTADGVWGVLGRIRVSGPGQKASANCKC